ncbi:transcriptional repressor [uncultured Bilophila sp.]|uniref:Fur family transcriptional regulator n=1 Tax=uncultured Bilophila sp. TaxID=529385 RepID=UPI00280C3DEE|nr:transcriptional repressor [uncultured Bilophila sp.]
MSGGQGHVDPETVFTRFLRGKGCHNTQQRRAIVSVFFQEEGHLTIEDLYVRVQAVDPTVGQSTVYRTMKLLCESGLAKEVSFGGGVVRYEQASDWHHDHLICESCGKSIEVVDPKIEALQERLVRRYGFTPTQHRLYLYGVCPECIAVQSSSK